MGEAGGRAVEEMTEYQRHALFPISLSNQMFSSERILPLLIGLFQRYEKLIFLVADRLQIYNAALRVGQSINLSELMREFNQNSEYLEQRRRWLRKVVQAPELSLPDSRWQIMGIEELADKRCFKIFRNVMLTYYSDDRFRSDVEQAASDHARGRSDDSLVTLRKQLSVGYLLEEIALSVRIHVVGRIRDEYYLGEQALPILRLYGGHYSVRVEDLAEAKPEGEPARFYMYVNGNPSDTWKEVDLL